MPAIKMINIVEQLIVNPVDSLPDKYFLSAHFQAHLANIVVFYIAIRKIVRVIRKNHANEVQNSARLIFLHLSTENSSAVTI